jgi:hypothetical protein
MNQLEAMTRLATGRAQGAARETAVEEAVLDKADNGRSDAASTARPSLFVISTRQREGFRASVRGRMLDLAEPSSGHELAPTLDDLFILSIASDLAWSARGYLRAQGLAGEVSVSPAWRTNEDPRMAGIDATVTVSKSAGVPSAALAVALEDSIASRCLHGRLHFRVCSE